MNALSTKIVKAIDDGKAAAKQQTVGYKFIGGWPEGEKRGYKKGTHAMDMFLAVFLNHMPKEILTDEHGIIIH